MKKFLVLGAFAISGVLLGTGCAHSGHQGGMKCCAMSSAHEKHGADAAKGAEADCCKKMSEGASDCCKMAEKHS